MAPACPAHAATVASRPAPKSRAALELAEVFGRFYEACAERHQLTAAQRRTARDIQLCRTAALGGHLAYCGDCGHEWPAYNSCRNRHCPKCQGAAQLAWIRARLGRVLDTHYFHVVFTVPEPLRPLALVNPEAVYDLLLTAAGQTLLGLGHDPRRLGGELGVTAVLHTWSRDLNLHPHVHCIVTGGGLSPDGCRWLRASGRYLFPGRVMAALFRGKVLAGLEALRQSDRLRFAGKAAPLAHPVVWDGFKDRLYRIRWVAYAKRPFGGPAQVITYLGRYTHRVAISSNRLLSVEGERVRFRTRGTKQTSLTGVEFVRRFLLHVLPKGFRKIRHYGLMSPVRVRTRLAQARALLEPKVPPAARPEEEPELATPDALHGPIWEPCCPNCGSLRIGRCFEPLLEGAQASHFDAARGPPAPCQPGASHV